MRSIPYGKQYITNEDIEAVINVLKSDFLTQGPQIELFEKNFSNYIGSKYAVAVSSGTAALHLSALSLSISQKDKVITTPITFAATANSILYCGGEVHFVDIDPSNYCIDLNKTRELLSKYPKGTFNGIIIVDFAGYPVNIKEFYDLAQEYNLWIIEDACHALGGSFISNNKEYKCGDCSFSDMAIFSFHPVKHITTGEGGMITTNNENLYNKLLMLRTHGITKNPKLLHKNDGGWYYEMQELGFNYRLTDIQAALGLSQLKKATKGLERRINIAKKYYQSFINKPYIKGQSGFIEGHAYHLYIIEVDDRKSLYDYLRSKNIFTQVHYIPLHLMPFYKKFGWKEGDFPNAEKYYQRCLSLPIYSSLTDEEQEYVINSIIKFYE